MQSVTCTLTFLALGLVSCSWSVAAGDMKGPHGGLECLQVNKTMEQVKAAGLKCIASLKLNEADMPKSIEDWESDMDDKCFSQCFAMEIKWTDKMNKVARSSILELICDKSSTPESKTKITTEWNTCLDKFEKDIAGADDATSCKTYKAAHVCLYKNLKNNCVAAVKPQ